MKQVLKSFLKPIVERFPGVAAAYRFARDRSVLNREPETTPFGFKFFGSPEMQRGEFEPVETDLVRRLLPMADVVINVGANVGYYCCLALSAGKSVVAFEPIDLNTQILLHNIKLNGWASNIDVFPIALGNKRGVIEIYGAGTGASLVKGWAGGSESAVRLVPCSTLDHVIGQRYKDARLLLIIDVEGAEKAMLEGAWQFLIMNPKPVWLVEIMATEHQPDGFAVNPNLLATFDLFWANGYRAYTADARPRVVSRSEVQEISRTGINTIPTHNFLFLGEDDELGDFAGGFD